MCRPKTKRSGPAMPRPVAIGVAAIMLGTTLAGCSDLYLDRRDTIAAGAGDEVATNEIAQMVDPWPPQSGNPNIAVNGQRMQSALERYRTNLVTQPVDPMMLSVANVAPPTAQTSGNTSSAPPPSIAPGSTTTTTTVVTSAPQASQ